MFVAKEINDLWVADMTYLPTWKRFLYLAVLTDVCNRKAVGWALGVQMTSNLVLSALNMALHTRKPESVILDFTRFNRHLLRSKLNGRVNQEKSKIPGRCQG